jgi:REP element-mobilizing transposase RayT
MAYTPRDESPGYHHVFTRGNNKRPIYVDDDDRRVFCTILDRVALKYGWAIHAYCLMGNHYHLVLRVGEKGLSRGMCELNTGWAVHFNSRHDRINHLFGRRFSNRKIDSTKSLLSTIRYVVQNPRRAGAGGPLEAARWTSYAATIGIAFSAVRLARDEVLQLFARTPQRAVERFREFCEEIVPSSLVKRQPP